MKVQKFSRFKRLAIVTVTLAIFWGGARWIVPAEAADQKHNAPGDVIVAQNAAQTSTGQEEAPLPQSQKSESKTDKKNESAGPEKKPLREFRPTEQIEAEQAVDFPYDI